MEPTDQTVPAAVTVDVDVAASADYPLSKGKFGMFNSGIVPLAHYQRDDHTWPAVRAESLRIDLAWGAPWAGWAHQPVGGTATHLHYDHEEMDAIARLLTAHDVWPYWSYCYMPAPLQRDGDWRSAPTDLDAWGAALAEFARHYRTQGIRIGYHEIYNEPDLYDAATRTRVFFTGTLADYLAMYRVGVRGIRAGDPDAVVGGPALSLIPDHSWVEPFLDYVRAHDLPLDFFSFHHYDTQSLPQRLAAVRASFAARSDYATTELHLNEYNAYPIDYPQGGTQDRHGLAAALLQDYHDLLAQPWITKVSWAQFLDSGQGNYSGMVTIDGHRKAIYNAVALYARLPVDRCPLSVNGAPGIAGLASADAHRACALLWNRSGADQEARVQLHGLPFEQATLQVYRIDATHASWGDDPSTEELAVCESAPAHGSEVSWSGPLPHDGVVYLEVVDVQRAPRREPTRTPTVVRTHHYYPDRTTTAYADFDRTSWTARLGMAQEDQATCMVGVTADNLPPVLAITVAVDGALRHSDDESLLGLRLDYRVDGAYTSSLLLHGPYDGGTSLYTPTRSSPMPWGTGRQPDHIVSVANLARFTVDVTALAPIGWDGRVQLTFILQNAGRGTRAKIVVLTGYVPPDGHSHD